MRPPHPRLLLTACCAIAFAKLVDPQLWMMGLDIPASAFGAAWEPYRAFSGVNAAVMTAFLLFGGLLGDRMGRRRILLVGASTALVANLLCLVSQGPAWFVLFRGVEGLGSALAFPMTLALIQGSFDRRGSVVALLIYTLVTALGALASLSALALTAAFGWRATLVVPICAGAAGLWFGFRYVPETPRSSAADSHRAVVITGWSLMLLAVVLSVLTWRAESSWENPVTIIALLIGALGGVILVLSRRRSDETPTKRALNWHQRHALTVMLLSAVVLNLALSAYLAQVYTYFTTVHQAGPALAGLALAPVVLACVVLARPAGRLALRIDARHLIAGGLLLMGFAFVLTAALAGPTMPYWPFIVPMAAFSFAFLVAQTAWTNAFLHIIPAALVGASAGTSKAASQVGTWLGTSLLAMLVLKTGQADFASRLAGLGLSSDGIARATYIVDALLRADTPGGTAIPSAGPLETALLNIYQESYAVGLWSALISAACVCIIMALVVWVVFRAPPAQPAKPSRPVEQLLNQEPATARAAQR